VGIIQKVARPIWDDRIGVNNIRVSIRVGVRVGVGVGVGVRRIAVGVMVTLNSGGSNGICIGTRPKKGVISRMLPSPRMQPFHALRASCKETRT